MFDSLFSVGLVLIPKTILYPIDNIVVYQQSKKSAFINSMNACRNNFFKGYLSYLSRILIGQTIRWECIKKINDRSLLFTSITSTTTSTIIVHPLEIYRQIKITGSNLCVNSFSKRYIASLPKALIYTNLHSLIELNLYMYLLKKEHINLIATIILLPISIKFICFPFETMMRLKIEKINHDFHGLKELYRGFLPSTCKNLICGYIQYLTFRSIIGEKFA